MKKIICIEIKMIWAKIDIAKKKLIIEIINRMWINCG
jgi:hypothetical protein